MLSAIFLIFPLIRINDVIDHMTGLWVGLICTMDASQQAPDVPLPRIVAAAVTSVIERADKNSKYVFQVEVRCSDGTQSTCYRGYQDFFDFHCQLLDQFPEEAGTTKGSNRVIPYLPGKKIFRRSTKSLALQRLPQLHQYSQELIALPDNISNSTLVIHFFKDDWSEDTMQYFKNKDTPTSQHQTHSEGVILCLYIIIIILLLICFLQVRIQTMDKN